MQQGAVRCGEKMNNSHILQCIVINPKEQTSLQKLINGDIYEMKMALEQWNTNMKTFEEITPQDSNNICKSHFMLVKYDLMR